MPAAPAEGLRELHALQHRAKVIRDRLASGPKALAAREAALAKRQAEADALKKAIRDSTVQADKKEGQLKGMQAKSDELRVKLNSIKKQVEYDAIRNQLAADNLAQSKLQEEILEARIVIEAQAETLKTQEAEIKKIADEVAATKADIAAKASEQETTLAKLDEAVKEAEVCIPEEEKERYVRSVKQRGADALAAVEESACSGCYVSVTTQMMNELINGHRLVYCNTCGRILYLPEEVVSATRRSGR
jgi:predicted  nucleic acid-binding Zn-ribbon protein